MDFSSGAVYGRETGSVGFRIDPNRIQVSDYYALAKLYSEAKHRAHGNLNIADIRIFSYFSQYADPNSGYLMTDILKAVLNKDVLKTTDSDLIRDYVSPDDLFALIRCCMAQEKLNTAFDAFSGKPVSKLEILAAFQEKFGLRTEISAPGAGSPNSTASVYIPKDFTAGKIGFQPRFTALDGLIRETSAALKKAGLE